MSHPLGQGLLVLGGARSGKSRHAQRLAEATNADLVFIATAQAFDAEMEARIARHQGDRGARWRLVEAPIDLPGAIAATQREGVVLLVDCLTLWVSNLLLADEDADVWNAALLDVVATSPSSVVLVANEVGLGIVPDNALARRFRDLAGTLNQRLAARVERVDLVVAGLAVRLK